MYISGSVKPSQSISLSHQDPTYDWLLMGNKVSQARNHRGHLYAARCQTAFWVVM